MDLAITFDKLEEESGIREGIVQRIRKLAAAHGPFTRASFRIIKEPWHSAASFRIQVVLEIPPESKVEVDIPGPELAHILDHVFVKLTALISRVLWERDGVPYPCRWCDGREFVFVPHPADQIDGSEPNPMRLARVNGVWLGELEVLVCRTCGHLEWFVSTPEALPVGQQNLVAVHTRTDTPFRD